MENPKATILVVDDEALNLEILVEHLEDEEFLPVTASDGVQAWELLQSEPERFDAVLLDRMMPRMDGMEVLSRIKRHPRLQTLPVIMQTAAASKENALEGLKAGAYYYLTKPFEREALLAIVETAVADHGRYRALQQQLASTVRTLSLMEQGRFVFRTLDEGRDLAALLANASPAGQRLVIGLSELFLNAVEHGNLGIGYQEKSELNEQGTWQQEVERRLALAPYAQRRVRVEYTLEDQELRFLISDQGDGFEWRTYLEIAPERAFDTHGRGIAMARALSFDRLEYLGRGNEVLAVLRLD